MAKFLNTATNEVIETEDPEDEAIYSEARKKGFEGVLDVVDTKTGETHQVLRTDPDLRQGLDSGRFVIPVLYEARKAERAAKTEDVGPVAAAGLGFAKSATMGGAPAIGGLEAMRKGGDYGEGRKTYEAREEAAWEKYPTTYGLGYTAGVLPGIAAKGITKAGQVALGAAAPLIEQITKVDEPITAERAKEVAVQTGLGAGLGGLGALAQGTMPTAAQKMGEMAERRAVKAIGADVLKPQRRIERMPGGRQEFGRDLLETGIVTAGKSVPQMGEKAIALAKTSGEAIGKTMKTFDEQIGAPSISRNLIVSEIESIPAELAKNPAKVALAQRIESSFVQPMRDWASRGEASTLEELWQIRSGLDDLAYTPTGVDKPLNKELQKIRKIIESRLEKTARAAGISDEQLKAYERSKRIYQVSKEAAATTKEKMDRMQSNRALSLTDYLSGGALAGAGATVAGASGGTVGAIMGALGNKLARERGPQVAAATMAKLSDMMKTNPERFQAIIGTFVKTGAIELGE
jgi:hypothetical protein